MAYVPVPKDLTLVKTKVLFNLTKRQLICFSLAAAVGVPVYFLARMMLMVAVMIPFVFLAIYEKDGQPAEKFVGHFIRSMIIRDKVRPYRTDNLYAYLQREIKRQEDKTIGR